MARRGKFGRLPRNAPDLTGALVALIREAAAQVDRNFVDAWQNGGEVDGKPATDARLLEHFKMRRDQLSPDDPLWDEWDNRVKQYTYSIDESKMMVKWENEKISEREVSQFYRNWMAKTPKNTEFYRELARNAGKWHAAARAKGRASRGRAASNAQATWEQNYFERHVLPAQHVDAALVQLAKHYGVMSESGDDLSDLDTTAAKYGEFLDILDGEVPTDANFATLISGVVATVRKTYPNFEWTKTDIRDVLDGGKKGALVLQGKATTKGNRTQYGKFADNFSYTNARIDDLDEIQRSFVATESFDRRMAACSGEPNCERNAMKVLRNDLQRQMNTMARSGILLLDTSVTGPIQQTIDNATTYINGGTVSEQETSWDLFDLQGKMVEGGARTSSWFTGNGDRMYQSNERLQNGGWISYVTGDDGTGRPKVSMVVHDTMEEPPVNAIEVEGAGQIIGKDGQRHSVKAFATPTTVFGHAADPQSGQPTTDPVALYDIVETMDFSTGRMLKYYRVKDESTGKFVFTLDEPVFTNGQKRTGNDGKTAIIVFPQVVPEPDAASLEAPNATIAPESNIAALTAKNKDGMSYVQGTYLTGGGVLAGAAIEDAYNSNSPFAEAESRSAVSNILKAVTEAHLRGDTETARALQTDFLAASQTSKLYREGKQGSVLDNSFAALHDRTPEQAAKDAQLQQAGITRARLGDVEYDARVTMLARIDELEASGYNNNLFDRRYEREHGGDRFGRMREDVYDTTRPATDINIPGLDRVSLGLPMAAVPAAGAPGSLGAMAWLQQVGEAFATRDVGTGIPTPATGGITGHPTTRTGGTGIPTPPGAYQPPPTSYTPPGTQPVGPGSTWAPPLATPNFIVPPAPVANIQPGMGSSIFRPPTADAYDEDLLNDRPSNTIGGK